VVIAVNAGARLDRLPVSSFHYRIFWLVGAGMFFDGYDLYVAGGVLASCFRPNSRLCRKTCSSSR
jgi:MFS transporter, putative metabolite:H+ symporter